MFLRKKYVLPAVALSLAIGLTGCSQTGLVPFSSGEEETESFPDEAAGTSAAEGTDAAEADVIYGVIDGESEAQEETSPDGRYAYQTLSDTEKTVYDEIVRAITDREETAPVSTVDVDEIEQAYLAIQCDHCEFFWMGSLGYVVYTRGDDVVSIDIEPQYTMTAEEQEELQQRIDAEADRMLEGAPVDGSDFDKALYVYETLIREVNYDINAADGQTIISAFLEHATVCQGYSYATQYLLGRLDIPCTTVTGTANGEAHAWNLVRLDGAYYYIDTTWGNSQFVNGYDSEIEEIVPYKFVNYDYFGVTTQMLSATHQPDGSIPLPLCEAEADNYYVHEGLYIDEWDPDRIGGILQAGYENGDDIVRIRFADRELFGQALQYFMTDGAVFDYCRGLQSVRYLELTDTNVLVAVFDS